MSASANHEFVSLLGSVRGGLPVSPRGLTCFELRSHTTKIDMNQPIVTHPNRSLDYRFMLAEARWILSGSRDLNHPALTKNLKKYSDNGSTMNGAYGPPFRQQIPYVADLLWEDPDTRQAVMTLWERSPRSSKDIPCTVALQFMVRDKVMHTNVFMRSSDAWLGWPYDVFSFTMMTQFVILHRQYLEDRPTLGTLSICAGSQHLYARNFEQSEMCLVDGGENLTIDTHSLNTPEDLMKALECGVNAPNDPLSALKSTGLIVSHNEEA